jgi:hypothetical protein
MKNSTRLLVLQQDSPEETLLFSVFRLASAWDARLSIRSYCTSPILSRYKSMEALRQIPILRVAEALGVDIVKTGSGTYAMREGREITSLTLFEKTNNWHRFSGKEQGGVSRGSTIDLVIHCRECSLRSAVDFLTSRFL